MILLASILISSHSVPTNVDWKVFGNDPGGSHYSSLAQINTQNVKSLDVAWTYHTKEKSENVPIQCTPIVVEGTMFVVTAGHRVVALNPENGAEKWAFDSKTDLGRSGHAKASRGVAYWSDNKPNGQRRILYGTPDGRIVSLDAHTGLPDPNFRPVDLHQELGSQAYIGVSAAPSIYNDLVYVGIANDEGGGAALGDIMAFSVKTGERKWTFHVIPKPGEFGNDTWLNNSSKNGGAGGAWNGYVVDQKRGILYAATGSVAPDFNGKDRPGDNLFGDCIIALDAKTGKRLWHFQTVHHDLWDHDNASPPILCTVNRKGKSVDAVAQLTKTGFCFVFDRVTGKPLFDIREVPAPPSELPGERAAATQPEPVLPPPLTEILFTKESVTNLSQEDHEFVMKRIEGLSYGKKYLPQSAKGTIMAPGYFGGSPWSCSAFDPRTNRLYVNTNNVPAVVGNYEFLKDSKGYPGVKPPWGNLTAIDLNSGQFVWRKTLGEYKELTQRGISPTGTMNLGGPLATAGNIVFIGSTCDRTFRAFDSRNGRVLREFPLPASAFAAPMTYSVGGKQFVVIAASGGGYGKAFGQDRGPVSDSFVCYALPSKI
jgi:quinoprotein glucose dehydrogenase